MSLNHESGGGSCSGKGRKSKGRRRRRKKCRGEKSKSVVSDDWRSILIGEGAGSEGITYSHTTFLGIDPLSKSSLVMMSGVYADMDIMSHPPLEEKDLGGGEAEDSLRPSSPPPISKCSQCFGSIEDVFDCGSGKPCVFQYCSKECVDKGSGFCSCSL